MKRTFRKYPSNYIRASLSGKSSTIINTNNGDYEITPFGKGFTVQLEGDEVYFDTYNEALAAIMEDAGQAVNASTGITASIQYEPEDCNIGSYQAQCRAKKNNVLCIPRSNGRIDRYGFHSIDGKGDVYEPETGSGEWWTSYIVTPDNKLLSWEFSGRYTPVDAVYGKDFWVEDNSQAVNATTKTDRDFKAVPLRSLKKGAWFTIKPIAEPTDKQVYIKDDYDREEKKFMCGRCDDISYSTFFKGDKMVYDDSNFEY